jgi:hypothetical protein
MDSRRVQQGMRRMPARYQPITDDEMLNEGEYDDEWPVRPHSSTRRYQGPADVRTEAGRAADVQTPGDQRGSVRSTGERHTIPPRRTATQARLPALPKTPPVRVSLDEEEQPVHTRQTRTTARIKRPLRQGQRRLHWLFFVGLAMLAMVLGWIALSAAGSWWQTTLNDWRYGRPRTYQTDAVVGHHDSSQNPSHFIALNLNRHIIIIEIPGGDISKSVIYNGPTLLGTGQDLTPVTLSFQDVNHDGKPDMLVNVQGNLFVFLNENGTFVPSTQNLNPTG